MAAARDAGVRRIVYTSHMGADPASLFAPMPDHAATEQMLADSGVPFTALRNGFYAATVPMLLGPALQSGRLAVPADGPVSWTSHADLAEAAAVILTEGGFDGPTPPLTATEALDLTQIAELAAGLLGRPLVRTVLPVEEYQAGLVAHGVPAAAAEMLGGLFAASRAGEFATTDPTLEKLLGHPTRTIRDLLTETLAVG